MKRHLRARRGAAARIRRAAAVLEREYGTPRWTVCDPLDELMVTLLSQNTNDANRDAAYRRLQAQFPSWEEVEAAGVERIEAAIRPAGLARQKSRRMKELLGWVRERFGRLTLDPLREMSDGEVFELLTARKGVGVKTAAVVAAFALDRDLCPVDTHVHRLARRLGWVRSGASADETFHTLRPLIPQGEGRTFHLNLLKFGRNICTARSPACSECPLWSECSWEGKSGAGVANIRRQPEGKDGQSN